MFKQKTIETKALNNNIKDLLAEFLDTNQMGDLDLDNNLSTTQKKAFELFKKGESMSIIGSGGTGKSHLIKTMQEYNNSQNYIKNMYLSATTGVAAYNIGGMTINSFMGIGTGEQDINYLIRKVYKNKSITERIKMCDILVIDEISMLSALLFEKINIICQSIRKSNKLFGGIQLILSSDYLQLNPVFNRNIQLYNEPEDTRLIIESDIFNNFFNNKNKNIIVLNENFRQKNDKNWAEILLRIRTGIHTKEDLKVLSDKVVNFKKEYNTIIKKNNGAIPIHIVATNKQVQKINELNLKKLDGIEFKYLPSFQVCGNDNDIIDIMKKELESQFKQRGIYELILKNGARVMLLRNIDVQIGLINGSIGTIIEIKNKIPIVKFDNGITTPIDKLSFELEINNNKVTASQIPLMLAYSLSIHKCQGLSLDNAIMDLNNCFCNHQIYVALSRIRTINGLLLKSFDPMKITVDKKIIKYLEPLN